MEDDLRALEQSDALTALRHTVKRGTFEEVVTAELAVIRSALVRLVVAVMGDQKIGVAGAMKTLRNQAKRLDALERAAGEEQIAAKTTRRNWGLLTAVASVGAGAALTAKALWDAFIG